ncbi:gamma-glutamyltransferase [Aliidongia dinghuensis]|uniref:Gamma-glutamyltransferase n=1 Tax=Aliidongia dinghuensis TaxID=1867774 RepID=A0A8J3E7D6_9PROT|nr:gamma-glutamyltransferase [Aliidongia dinghuensis]GGF51613.1 gamma-glutamyltransferase [Aliidongia dinghuensis]
MTLVTNSAWPPASWRTEAWSVAKPARTSRGGLVACQHHLAAAAGVELLRAGGNAVDAAVATAFALGVVEPWMSGIGGVGFMVAAEAKTGKVTVVDFGPVAPAGLDPARYPLASATAAPSMFGWPAVEDGRNDRGYEAAVVPGAVDGLGLALESLGRKSLAEVLAPAIRLAEIGLPLDWHSALAISLAAADLACDPAAAAIYLPGGLPAVPPTDRPAGALPLGQLAQTLKRIAEAGRRDFYEGELAAGIAADLKAGGSVITAADLAGYRAELREPLVHDYKGVRLHFAGPLSGGPTVIQALDEIGRRLPTLPLGRPDGATFRIYAEALRAAHETRLNELGAGTAGNTTHLSVVDRDGNMVALTVTLLARFGARIVLPSSGILMNNAINWFDPRPGRPNSLLPGRRPLANMCPVVATRDSGPWVALGACGGRKILSAVTQLASMLIDYDLSLDSAFATPRLDASTERVLVDAAMDPEWIAEIDRTLPVEIVPDQVYPSHFAVPSAVMRDEGTGLNSAATHLRSPVAAVLGEEE